MTDITKIAQACASRIMDRMEMCHKDRLAILKSDIEREVEAAFKMLGGMEGRQLPAECSDESEPVTREMISAGVSALDFAQGSYDDHSLVACVYKAMYQARPRLESDGCCGSSEVFSALNGSVQVSSAPNDETIGLLVERGFLYGGVLLSRTQAADIARALSAAVSGHVHREMNGRPDEPAPDNATPASIADKALKALTDAHMPDYSGRNLDFCVPNIGFRLRVGDDGALITEPIPADDFYATEADDASRSEPTIADMLFMPEASDVQFAQDQVEITIEEAEKRGIPIGSAGYVWIA